MNSYTCSDANRFFWILSATTPKPVSSTARRASASACGVTAAAIASTMASIRAWESSASSAWRLWPRARARGPRRSRRDRDRCCGGERPGWHEPARAAVRTAAASAFGESARPRVRPRNDVHRDQLADTSRRGGARIGGGLHGADVAAHHDRDVPGADVFLGVSSTLAVFTIASAASMAPIKPAGLDEPKCFASHVFRMLRAGLYHFAPRPTTAVSSGVFIRRHAQTAMTPRSLALSVCLVPSSRLLPAGRSRWTCRPWRRRRSRSRPREVPLGSPVEVTYKFLVAQGATFDDDYTVLVHFLDSDDELMWTDDHQPPVPTRTWKPGQTIEYKRTMFVPIYPLHRAGHRPRSACTRRRRRAPAAGGEIERPARIQGRHASAAAALRERLPPVQGRLAPGRGRRRTTPPSSGSGRRSRATITFRNPKKRRDVLPPCRRPGDSYAEPQVMTVKVNGQQLDTIPADPERRVRAQDAH